MPILFIIMGIYLGLILAGYMVTFSDISPAIFISLIGMVGLIVLYIISGTDMVLSSKSPRLAKFITNRYLAILAILTWVLVIPMVVFLDTLDKLAIKYYPDGDN